MDSSDAAEETDPSELGLVLEGYVTILVASLDGADHHTINLASLGLSKDFLQGGDDISISLDLLEAIHLPSPGSFLIMARMASRESLAFFRREAADSSVSFGVMNSKAWESYESIFQPPLRRLSSNSR